MASFFRTTVRNGYHTVRLVEKYVILRILTYMDKRDVPCLVMIRVLCECIEEKKTSRLGQKSFVGDAIVMLFHRKLCLSLIFFVNFSVRKVLLIFFHFTFITLQTKLFMASCF